MSGETKPGGETEMRERNLRTTAVALLACLTFPLLGQTAAAGTEAPPSFRCEDYANRLIVLKGIRRARIQILEDPEKFVVDPNSSHIMDLIGVGAVGVAVGTVWWGQSLRASKVTTAAGAALSAILFLAYGKHVKDVRDQVERLRRENAGQISMLQLEDRQPTAAELGHNGQGYVHRLGALSALMEKDRTLACRYLAKNAALRARIDQETNAKIAGELLQYQRLIQETPALAQDSLGTVNQRISDLVTEKKITEQTSGIPYSNLIEQMVVNRTLGAGAQ
jgi:hypothetical protein